MTLLARSRRAWRRRSFVYPMGLLKSPGWAYGEVVKWPMALGRHAIPLGGSLHIFSSYREAA